MLQEDAFRRRFRQYSWNNTILIYSQKPAATYVAGYKTWQALGRQVSRGEWGLTIFAPMILRIPAGEAAAEAPEEGTAPVVSTCRGFRLVQVFDVSQTHGNPLPEPPPPPRLLPGDDAGLLAKLQAFATGRGTRILEEPPIVATANGQYHRKENTIRLRPTLPPLQKAKTLAHELGHALLHQDLSGSQEIRKVEAESVAYVVLACAGFDAGAFSLPYLAGYTQDPQVLAHQVGRILQAADTILTGLAAEVSPAVVDPSPFFVSASVIA